MCTWELCINSIEKMHKTTKRTKKGEWEGCDAGRMWFNPTGFTVRTELKRRPNGVPRRRSQKHAHPDKKNGCPDESTLPSGQPESSSERFTHTKLKKRGKIAEKYFPNNLQSTHVYNTDISVQLEFQKYPKI